MEIIEGIIVDGCVQALCGRVRGAAEDQFMEESIKSKRRLSKGNAALA